MEIRLAGQLMNFQALIYSSCVVTESCHIQEIAVFACHQPPGNLMDNGSSCYCYQFS